MSDREPLRRTLRDACSPGLDDDAAGRIADGAWERAARLRAAESAGHPAVRRRRWGWAAAAAALLAGVAVLVRPATPAFAVDGDPVQVHDDGRWEDARRILPGSWVFVPAGERRIHSRDGSEIEPRPGAVFRIVANRTQSAAWRVEMQSGDAEVAGASIVLELANAMRIARADEPGAGTDGLRVLRLAASAGPALAAPPVRLDAIRAEFTPTVRVVRGAARVANLHAPEFAILHARETLAWMRPGNAASAEPQLVPTFLWSPQVALDVASGANPVGGTMRGDGMMFVTLCRPGGTVSAVQVPGALGQDALAHMTLLAAERAARENRHASLPSLPRRVALPPLTTDGWRSYEVTKDGVRTVVTLRGDGTVALERTGFAERAYPSLAALRAAVPQIAALFGDSLNW